MVTLPDLFPEADPAAQAAIRSYCGWHIAPSVEETVFVDGPGGTLLELASLYVTAVASVSNDGRPVVDPEWSRAGMIRHHGWSTRFRGVEVTFSHGYLDCPDDIRQVVTRLAQSAAIPVGAVSQSAGPFAVNYGQSSAVGIDAWSRSILDRYKLPPRP